MKFENTLEFARHLDETDPLKSFRDEFFFPKSFHKKAIYLCGNSLGLQPKSTEKYIKRELKAWRNLGVEGHTQGEMPWMYYHHFFGKSIAKLTGAKESEVVVMNQLTVNLNLMLISFYQPLGKRNKILVQANEFPSDYYAIEQQIKLRGLDPKECIIEVSPRKGEQTLRTEDITAVITDNAEELALVMFSAVNYYTGQFYDLASIGAACAKHNIFFGVDLAHAIGNVELKLSDWNVDFATWCSYKYLNSGPGGVSGIYVNTKHGNNPTLPRLAGWWGNEEKTRFKMEKHFVPQSGAAGWQISNAPVLSMAAHKASLDIFDRADMKALRKKSELLTGYLEWLLTKGNPSMRENEQFSIITPAEKNQRGAQISIQTKKDGKKLFKHITEKRVIADWREPDVIRVAPVPLYNTFSDVYKFASLLS